MTVIQSMTPAQIVAELDKHIVGQNQAKRAVAIALRNRWRRQQVAEPLRHEITPKNILMIGATGIGKTEIARRLAKLAQAPFIKIEATKFTEVGYVGRDVDSIIRDLAEIAVKETRELEMRQVRERAQNLAEDKILDILLPPPRDMAEAAPEEKDSTTRQIFRKKLREGQLDDKEIEIEIAIPSPHMEIMTPPGMEEMAEQLKNMFSSVGTSKKGKRKLKVKEAFQLLLEEEAGGLLNKEEINARALRNLEENGIVFLDEIDKICARNESSGADVSRAGVQRDLLPLVEGTTVNTKFGMVRTDHILFIASGAFHLAKPSDLIPELQGRFPIRVELSSLSVEDFAAILTQTDACLTKQYQALLNTESITLEFVQSGVQRIAQIAFDVNERDENIGARRLHTLMEKLLEDLSFSVDTGAAQKVVIDEGYVDARLAPLASNRDISRYVL